MTVNPVLPRIQRLKGRRESLQVDAIRVEKAVGIAKARQEHKESVEGVLDDLERRFHERSMGILESLLGAFLNDVLPRGTDMGEQSVTMSLDTQRGLPALQVAVRNGEQVEDALRGRGGSVANVLSAGLRFIAIARTGGRANTLQGVRPFLVLDEADCWLSPERVPAFSEVIHSLTYDLGVQVLMISHHDTALLKGFPVHLERVAGEDGFPSVRVRHLPLSPVHLVGDNPAGDADDATELENEKLSEDNYTRLAGIRLENFLSHEDSLIPLTAGVTVLTGDNDVGKSAVTEAFRAIAYNDSSDTVIRHGASESRVSLLFADGTRITWVRVRKGSPKTTYQLYADDELIRETPAPKEVPEWVRILLGMDLREKMDVHIGDQKSPVFLLDQSPSQRAAILDIGRESQHLRILRERWKHQVDEDRRTIREGEKQLALVRRSLSILAPLDEIEEDTVLYGSVAARCASQIADAITLQDRLGGVFALRESVRMLSALNAVHPVVLPTLPNLEPGIRLWRSAGRLREALRVTEMVQAIKAPELPDAKLLNTGFPLFRSATRLRTSVDLLKGRNLPTLPVIPALPDLSFQIALYEQCTLLQKRMRIWVAWRDDAGMPHMDFVSSGVTVNRLADGYRMGRQALDLRKAIKQSEAEHRQLMLERDQAEKGYQDKLHEFGVCPFCGSTASH